MGLAATTDVNHENYITMLEEANGTTKNNLAKCIEFYNKIKWKKIRFTIPLKPEPSHRPRLCGYRVYVPGAAKNQRFFQKKVLPTLKGLFITTPCIVNVDIFCETPSSFTKTQKILAEMKILRPWGNIGDVDNFAKAVYDMCQPNEARGNTGIMENDCLIMESMVRKFYSKTPRYELTISYMKDVPIELNKILRLKGVDNDE